MFKNVVTINDPAIGPYEVAFSDEQMKRLIQIGATAVEKGIEGAAPEGVVRHGPTDPHRTHAGGFVGNKTDWSARFPDNSDVPALIEKAKRFERDFAIAMKALTVFLGAGLLNQNLLTDPAQVANVVGPFFDLYGKDMPDLPASPASDDQPAES